MYYNKLAEDGGENGIKPNNIPFSKINLKRNEGEKIPLIN